MNAITIELDAITCSQEIEAVAQLSQPVPAPSSDEVAALAAAMQYAFMDAGKSRFSAWDKGLAEVTLDGDFNLLSIAAATMFYLRR